MRLRQTDVDVATPEGPARAHISRPSPARGTLVLGHGAGGGFGSPDLLSMRALTRDGWTVVLVEQPWLVAGRRVATLPPHLDVAWLAVVQALGRRRGLLARPLVLGGRSAGARVACRTAGRLGADAVLALSFPLQPPARNGRGDPPSRAGELREVTEAAIPLLVVQGSCDPFGTPEQLRAALGAGPSIVETPGTHRLTSPQDVLAACRSWLSQVSPRRLT